MILKMLVLVGIFGVLVTIEWYEIWRADRKEDFPFMDCSFKEFIRF